MKNTKDNVRLREEMRVIEEVGREDEGRMDRGRGEERFKDSRARAFKQSR